MENPRLLGQVRDALRVRHYSLRTEASYLQWIKRYISIRSVTLATWVSRK